MAAPVTVLPNISNIDSGSLYSSRFHLYGDQQVAVPADCGTILIWEQGRSPLTINQTTSLGNCQNKAWRGRDWSRGLTLWVRFGARGLRESLYPRSAVIVRASSADRPAVRTGLPACLTHTPGLSKARNTRACVYDTERMYCFHYPPFPSPGPLEYDAACGRLPCKY
ncbi:hypothetical protein Bbelb_402220 [Branchiostoma belcheri]|nr:hypothetical protein Bbelb_402220 [Branchiostoma belcheri]